MTTEQYQSIQRYLRRELSEKEKATLLEELNADEAFRQEFNMYRLRIAAQERKKTLELKKTLEEQALSPVEISDSQEVQAEAKLIPIGWKRYRYQIAAAVVILGLLVWMMIPSPEMEVANVAEPPKIDALQLPLEVLDEKGKAQLDSTMVRIGLYHDPAMPVPQQYEFSEQDLFLSIYFKEASDYQEDENFRLLKWQVRLFLLYRHRWFEISVTAKDKRKSLVPVSDQVLLDTLNQF